MLSNKTTVVALLQGVIRVFNANNNPFTEAVYMDRVTPLYRSNPFSKGFQEYYCCVEQGGCLEVVFQNMEILPNDIFKFEI
jgi:hypothetical protein